MSNTTGIDKLEPMMHQVSDELMTKFNRLIQQSGKNEAEVDIWHELHSISIEVIGRCAFGRKFNAIGELTMFLDPSCLRQVVAAKKLLKLSLLL